MSDNKTIEVNNILLLEVRDDIKKISSDMHNINITITKQAADIKHHIKRTDLNETRIHRLEDFKWYFAGIAIIIGATIKYFDKFL